MDQPKRIIRFDVTTPERKISGAVLLEQERLAAGEKRQKHLALEYFACFAVDESGKKMPRVEVEAIFATMNELEIRLALHRLNSALQEQNLLMANQLVAPIPVAPSQAPKPGKRARPQAKE